MARPVCPIIVAGIRSMFKSDDSSLGLQKSIISKLILSEMLESSVNMFSVVRHVSYFPSGVISPELF